jgi:hypothetical protein
MMFTVPMEFLSAAILSKDAQAVSDELLRIGSLDAVTMKSVSGIKEGSYAPGSQAATGKSVEISRIQDLRRRVEGFLTLANPPIQPSNPADFSSETLPDLEVIEKNLGSIALEIQNLREGQKELQDKLLRLEELRRQAEAQKPRDSVTRLPSSASSVLAYRRGSVPEEKFLALRA